jgi:hypothetical protein
MKTVKIWALAASCGLVAFQSWAGSISVPTFGAIGGNTGFYDTGVGSTFGQNSGWTVTSGTVDFIGGYWQSPDGNQTVDMDGNNPGAIATTIDVPAAGTVTVDFDLSGNPDGGSSLKTLQVQLGSATPEVLTYTTGSNTHSDMDYVAESAVFNISTPGDLTLSFASLDVSSSPYGPVVATVTASEANSVPDGGFSLMLLGLSGAGLICLRRPLARLA